MRRRISKYRRQEISPFEDATIGCIMLAEPFFFPESEWIPVPEDFSLNILRGKGYDTSEEAGRKLWADVQLRLQGSVIAEPRPQQQMFGEPILVRPRLGQGTFRSLVTDLYSRRCAVTGERALPTLDAAHIKPVTEGGRHETRNGLLLRSDIHRLYDRGYVTVTPDHRFRVSGRLKTDFDNGEPYYPLEGKEIYLPSDLANRPHQDFLEWPADTVFRR